MDFRTVIGTGAQGQWCLVLDRAHFGLTGTPDQYLADGTEWCPHDTDCDGICAAYLGQPVRAEFFVACDPVAERLRSVTCN